MDFVTILIILLVGIPAFYMGKSSAGTPLANLDKPIDSRIFSGITYGSIALYQIVFNEIVKQLDTTSDTVLSDYDILRIEEIKNSFPFCKYIVTVYLAIMFQQYLVADAFERHIKQDQWVKLCTHQKAYNDADFFPAAEHFGDMFDRVYSVIDKS